ECVELSLDDLDSLRQVFEPGHLTFHRKRNIVPPGSSTRRTANEIAAFQRSSVVRPTPDSRICDPGNTGIVQFLQLRLGGPVRCD
ncbi:MAG TPA: hypothetical protein VH436_03855, partial [Vicinamibacterales bacterium]